MRTRNLKSTITASKEKGEEVFFLCVKNKKEALIVDNMSRGDIKELIEELQDCLDLL